MARVDHARLDRHAFFHAEPLHQALDALGAEDAQQIVLERQVEPRGAGIALASRAAAQLVVDAPRLVTLGAEDVRPPAASTSSRSLAHCCAVAAPARSPTPGAHATRARARRARETPALPPSTMSVPRPAMLVEIVERAFAARLRHDLGLARVLLGVQDVVLDAGLLEQRRRAFRISRSRWCRPEPAGRARGSRGCPRSPRRTSRARSCRRRRRGPCGPSAGGSASR